MKSVFSSMLTATALAALLAGCSSDSGILGSSLTTSSVDPAKAAAQAPKVDPACVALTAKIDALRKDGVTERVEKVAAGGKTSSVSVKRDSLAKISELDRANFEYQTRCSAPGLAKPIAPAPAAAAAVPPPAAKPAAKKTAAVTAKPAAAPAVTAAAAAPAAPAAPAPVQPAAVAVPQAPGVAMMTPGAPMPAQ